MLQVIVKLSVLAITIYKVSGLPATEYTEKFQCGLEEFTLYETCGWSFDEYMKMIEKRSMEELDLKDPSACLYNQYNYVDSVDFIVIGAGASGSVVAGRLSENIDWQVMILEAGAAAPTGSQIPAMYFNYKGDPLYDWNYELLPQDNACLATNGICYYPRGKVMGGTAILHGMMYMRGSPSDYDSLLPTYGIEGWKWADVLPYFLKSENNLDIKNKEADQLYHRTGGPLTVSYFNDRPSFSSDLLQAYKELGNNILTDLNGPTQKGFAIAQATTENGRRLTTAKAYIYDKLRKRNNLYVLPKARVLKIVLENKKAIGVIYERNGVKRFVRARKEVILSAGTIASPQILMLSGLGPKENLNSVGVEVIQDMPGVGQNLHNHVSTEIFFYRGVDNNTEVLDDQTAQNYFEKRVGPMTSTGLSQVTGFTWSSVGKNNPSPDLQIFHAGFMANCSQTGANGEPIGKGGARIFSISPTVLHARSSGWIKLRNLFPTSAPIIYGGMLTNKIDEQILLDGIRFVLKIVNTDSMKKNKVYLNPVQVEQCKKYPRNSDKYWKCYMSYKTNPENHQVGTCRMGNISDSMAVTDSELRVIGIQNLRVADASVLPRTPSGNLQAPAIMVGERAADFVKKTWKKY